MPTFFPVYIRRSDGKVDTKGANGKREKNEPLPDQLDTTPNEKGISDYYRYCQPGEAKEVDWRRKLGGMLLRELGGSDTKDKSYILAALPDNYRVYEHVKCKINEADGKPQKTTKNHAAGGNERQDAYLYGHPGGRRKRYRSPGEFFPHLLWLATDETGDPDNCGCKFCSPEEIDDDKPAPKVKEAKSETTKTTETKVKRETSAGSSTPASARNNSQTPQPPSFLPSPLPRFRSQEHKLDAHFDEFYYRLGEVVWFSKGSAWGLGVVGKRDLVRGFSPQHQYQVQPLSHPLNNSPMQTCLQDQLRPWLAWSPPPCTNAELDPARSRSGRSYTYDEIDWPGYLNGKYGPGEAEVDASILAAKSAESTFTPFGRIEGSPATAGDDQSSETHYNGIYIGGEKIWLGDPLRMRNSAEPTDIIVLHDIIERSNAQDAFKPTITLVGDTYSYRIQQLEPQSVPPNDIHLPQRLRADLHNRNNITSQHPNPQQRHTSFWKLQAKSMQVSIADIKGRWYESSIFMPLLDPDNFHQNRMNGDISDSGLWMNGQGDCNREGDLTSKPADLKTKKREEAFGRAVPPSFKISRGLDETKPKDAKGSNGTKSEDNDGSYQAAPQQSPAPVQTQSVQAGQHSYGAQSIEPNMQQPQYTPGQYHHSTTVDAAPGRNQGGMPYVSVPSMHQSGFEQYMKFDEGAGEHAAGMPGYEQGYRSRDVEQGYYGQGSTRH